MRAGDFAPELAANLVAIDSVHFAFVPPFLPPDLVFSPEQSSRIAEAERALGELEGAGSMLPNPELITRPFMRREAVLSSRIEGTIATIEQLVLFEETANVTENLLDVQEVSNYLDALSAGIQALQDGYPINKSTIRQLHEILMQGVRGQDKGPGHFRLEQNAIGRRGGGLADATYVPPPPGEVMPLLDDLERFIAHRAPMPLVAQLAVAHYQFEAIHPFMDGNGRIGRLLISLLLHKYQALAQPMLYLSDYFDRNRDRYLALLLDVSQRGRWNDWIDFFAEAVRVQSQMARDLAKDLLRLQLQYRSLLQQMGISARALTLVDSLFERPSLTIGRAATMLDITPRSAGMLVQKLAEAEIIKEVSGRERNRIYLAPGILALTEINK